jgi:hypothetical protein
MRFRRFVGVGYREFNRGIITDVTYKGLEDIVSRAKRWFSRFDDGSRFYSSKSDYKYVWKDGSELLFRSVGSMDDYENSIHGNEFNFISLNELTKLRDSDVFDALLSTNRTSFLPEDYPLQDGSLLPPMPLTVMPTTNPSGIGRAWVKKRFIDVGARGEIVRTPVTVYDPRLKKEVVIHRTQTHLFSTYKDNPKLDLSYIAQLESIENPVRKLQWTIGSWEVEGDGAFFGDAWDRNIHVIEPFSIPRNWRIYRAFDWGSSHPFSVLWFAENTDGDDITLKNGKIKSSLKGDIYLIHEWYGSVPDNYNKGLRLLATEISQGIIEREIMWGIHNRVLPGNADSAIWNVENGNSIAVDMTKPVTVAGKIYQGATFIRSDKKAGSRKAGWQVVLNYLNNAKTNAERNFRESAGLFIFNTNKAFIEVFPYLERDDKDPDDIDTDGADHSADTLRYFLYGRKVGVKSGKTVGLT